MSKKMIKVQMRKERVRNAMKKRTGQAARTNLAPEYSQHEMDYMEDWESDYFNEEKSS